jgi:naphthalene 1,2-dioxygenase ferredoxin component
MSQPTWTDVLAQADLPEDDVIGIDIAGHSIAICTVGAEVYAIDNLCTHGAAHLCDGFLDGHEIECPLHQGTFDVRDGTPLRDPATEAVRSWPVKIEGGRVYLQLD